MQVENSCMIPGRGTVTTGKIERGQIRVGETVEIVGLGETRQTVVTGIEMFHKECDVGLPGDNVGLLLRGLKREDVERGMVLVKPGTVKPHKKFKAQVYVLKKEERGRHTSFFTGYSPQFFFRSTDVTSKVSLADGVEICLPGDHVEVEVELQHAVALEEQLRFAVREGGKTVGAGAVIGIND